MLKIGDKIMVRRDLRRGKSYGMKESRLTQTFVYNMEIYMGRIVTIGRIDEYGYRILEDGGSWSWTDEMFELKTNEITMKRLVEKRGEV